MMKVKVEQNTNKNLKYSGAVGVQCLNGKMEVLVWDDNIIH